VETHPGITEITPGGCCAPMVDEALTESAAADLAKGFKALGDPVRLRADQPLLLSSSRFGHTYEGRRSGAAVRPRSGHGDDGWGSPDGGVEEVAG
jgi:hypothetical protein